jgi:hypothetical protein
MSASSLSRPIVIVAAIAGGVIVAMIVQTWLARRGIVLASSWDGGMRGRGTQAHAALAWWVPAIAAFVAGFLIAVATSRFTWLYLRSLRWVAGAGLVLALAAIAGAIPPVAAEAAGHHALATLTATFVALLMAGIGAFAVRR